MKENRNSILTTIFLVIITLMIPFTGSAQSKPVNDSTKVEPQALKQVQIPDFGKKTRTLINDIKILTENDKQLNDISPGVEDVVNTLDQKLAMLQDSVAVYQLDRLKKESRELALLGQRLTPWKTTIETISTEGENKDFSLVSMTNVWQLTLDSMRMTNSYGWTKSNQAVNRKDLESEIENFIKQLHASQNDLYTFMGRVQNIQTDITIAENTLGDASNLIEFRTSVLTQNIWLADSPPIWEIGKDTTMYDDGDHKLFGFMKSDWGIVTAYVKNQPKLPYYALVFLVSIFVTILYLKSRAKDFYKDYPEDLKDAQLVLQYPLIATAIIFWLSTLLFAFFPKELNYFISIFILVPLLIILWKLNTHWTFISILLFAISFILFFILQGMDYTFVLDRISLIVVDVLALVIFIYFINQKDLVDQMNPSWLGMLPFTIRAFIVVCFGALIANILGSVQLAQLLTYATLGTIIVLYTLKAAVSVTKDFLFLVLMGPLTKHSYILKDDGKMVLQKMDKLLTIVGLLAYVFIALELFNIRTEVLEAAGNIINYNLKVGTMSISLGNILAFFITIQIAMWLSTMIRYVLDKEIFPRTSLKQGVPDTISLLIKFTFSLLGILLAFSAAGIELDKIAIVMGALGVGIGFGLQDIINNFVSGIILALERPVTIGDLVDIPDASGVIKDIGLRSSIIRTWDGSDVIVPNGEFISNKLTNWTFYDRLRRIKVDVRVPFDTNIESVSELLLKTARQIPEVMKKPGPYLNFNGIGTSAMDINLFCWINDCNEVFGRQTAIRKGVYKALQDAGYDIPLPKQDLRLHEEGDPKEEKLKDDLTNKGGSTEKK